MFAYDFEGKRFDVGEKLGFVKTTIEFALQNEEIKEELLEFLEEILREKSIQKIRCLNFDERRYCDLSYRKRIPFLVMFGFNHCLDVDLCRLFYFTSII